jgi:hypothetical protein
MPTDLPPPPDSAAPRFISGRFTLTRDQLAEGMRLVRFPATPGARMDQWLSYLIQLGLAPLGGIALYLLVYRGLDLPNDPFPVWPLLLIGAGVAAMVMILGNRAEARVYDISLQSRFFSANGAEVSAAGMTFLGPDSRWQTGWADIDGLSRGATVAVVQVGVMYFPIPLAAFGDSATGAAAWRAMVDWHGAAAGAHE